MAKKCPNCGFTEEMEGAQFCGLCRTELVEVEPVPSPPPPLAKKGFLGAGVIIFLVLSAAVGLYYYFFVERPWTFHTEGEIISTPLCTDDMVFATSRDGYLYCLNRINGSESWTHKTGGEILTSPALSGTSLFVTSRDYYLYGIDINTREVFCSLSIGKGPNSPAFSDGRVYVTNDDYCYCIDPSSQGIVWHQSIKEKITPGPPLIWDGVVWFGNQKKRLLGLNAERGYLEAEINMPGFVNGALAVSRSNNALIIPISSKEKESIISYDLDLGTLMWSYERAKRFSTPTVYGDQVYAGCADGYLYCVDGNTGNTEWSFYAGGDVSSPSVTEKYVYFGTKKGVLYCLTKDGNKVREYRLGGPVSPNPIVSRGFIYAAAGDGGVYSFRAPEDETGTWPMFKYDAARTGCPQ